MDTEYLSQTGACFATAGSDTTHWNLLTTVLNIGASTVYNAFIAYCVANTVAPGWTKRTLISAAWFGLEVYTVIEMNGKRKFESLKEKIFETYPWLRLRVTHNDSITTAEGITKTCYDSLGNMLTQEDSTDARLIVTRDESTGFTHVIDTTLDMASTPVATNSSISQMTRRIDEKCINDRVLDYKFLSCSIATTNDYAINIHLNSKIHMTSTSKSGECNRNCSSNYSFYVRGNILMTKAFLLLFIRHYTSLTGQGSTCEKQIKAIEEGDYTVKIIDNRANVFVWSGDSKAIELHEKGPVLLDLSMMTAPNAHTETDATNTK